MCGIAGFCSREKDYSICRGEWEKILKDMNQAQKRRGPDGEGLFLSPHCGMAHVRLAVQDLKKGSQPMSRSTQGRTCTLCLDGEIYNRRELRKDLEKAGESFRTDSDAELFLVGYMLYGEEFVKRINGVFGAALWDAKKETLFLFRDRAGAAPLFYTKFRGNLIFASELKGILAYPGMVAEADTDTLCEIFALGPAKTYGKGVFKDIYEVLPGHYLAVQKNGIKEVCYWKLESHMHEDSFAETVEKTAWLIEDAVRLQMQADVPVCTFLSGGVDSSLVTAICAKELKQQGKTLDTYSFDFEGNQKYFQANAFQPSQDRPWVEKMADFCESRHTFLECDNQGLLDYLYRAVDARDLPCMADVESSMLYFCSVVAKEHKVVLTGECADEIFGGYPWFRSPKAFEEQGFPWSADMKVRQSLLSEAWIQELPMEAYAHNAYEKTIKEVPVLEGEQGAEKRRREIAYLNLKWFMATLLDRMNRTGMYSGLEGRVPFADHRIIEYVWNVPWEMKCRDGVVKGLLRHAGEGKLPKEVLWRKKSPYPKTYHPAYEKMLGEKLQEVLEDSKAPVGQFLDKKKVERFLASPSDYGKPWYGQLMAGPQMLAYMLQVNYWLEKYKVRIL